MPVYVGGANMVLKGTAAKMRQSSNSIAMVIGALVRVRAFPWQKMSKPTARTTVASGERGAVSVSASEICGRSVTVPFSTFMQAEGVKALQRGKAYTERKTYN